MLPKDLPVYKQKKKILKAIAENQVIVVESPTGSGKTTQLPMILYEAGYAQKGMIGVTQPRRIAAVSVCEYIARQLKTTVPDTVGYKMRFEDKTDPRTKIKIMTDGTLLQELKADYLLKQYNVIIVDEAHERSLNIDFILGLLKQIMESRKDFKVIISSATINAEVFSEYFDECPVVHIDTEIFPVGLIYDPIREEQSHTNRDAQDALILKITDIVERIIAEKRKGDILVFLSGEKQIKDCMASLYSAPFRNKLLIQPLYGRLSKEEQEQVFIPTPRFRTKVVIATNIAETSVTIDGITSIIDSGQAKMNYYNPRTYTSSLIAGPISKASCNQRKGRAGRTRPGSCYRLFTKKEFDNRPLFPTEEIYRTDLSEVVLRMSEIGITNFESFDFISPPGKEGILGAIETLNLLDALTPQRRLSKIGEMMVEFPLLPRLSRMIVEAVYRYPDVTEETLIATSFLSTNSPFLLPMGEEIEARKAHHSFRDSHGDFVSYLRLFRSYVKQEASQEFCRRFYLDQRTMAEIVNIKNQLSQIVSDLGIPILSAGSHKDFLCAISRGLIQFVCARTGKGVYRSLTTQRVQIHPGSVMFRETPSYIVAGEIVRTSRMFARSVSPLKQEWLPEISPILAENLIQREKQAQKELAAGGMAKSKRSVSSSQVILGHETFDLQKHKGKKMAVLPWKKITKVLKLHDFRTLPHYKGLTGKILYEDWEILTGEKLTHILRVIPYLNPEGGILFRWPRKTNFTYPQDLEKLYDQFNNLARLCVGKKKNKTLGFLALFSDGQGTYWFRGARSFYTAVSESLNSLEALIDDMDIDTHNRYGESVKANYRRLTQMIEGL